MALCPLFFLVHPLKAHADMQDVRTTRMAHFISKTPES